MRLYVLLGLTTALAACGGGGGGSLQSPGTSAVTPAPAASPTPTPAQTPAATPTPTPTPAATPAANGPSVAITPSPAANAASMIDVKSATRFAAVGGLQSLKTTTVTDSAGNKSLTTLYAGNASAPASSSGTISYDPRDGIFTMTLGDTKANVTRTVPFQDPVHRTDFTGARYPNPSIIELSSYNYLAAADGDGTTAFFYQRPGTRTFFVTLGGFVHYTAADSTSVDRVEERGAFAFGSPTLDSQIPRTGSGHFEGDFLATMTSKNADIRDPVPTRMQWINGGTSIDVDFSRSLVSLVMAGRVSQAFANGAAVDDSQLVIPSNSIFNATGSASIDAGFSAFAGQFASASFTNGATVTPVDFAGVTTGSSTAGASSIDGTFYGPNAIEVGGSFRIIGGIPDQRLDIAGGFTGRKK